MYKSLLFIALSFAFNFSIFCEQPVILFTNARDESHIKEWAAHHLLLGFDLIYIFDHKSREPLTSEFKKFDKRVIVERCDWENPVKYRLMERAAHLSRELNAAWMLYLDADEFLILNHFSTIKGLLNAFPHADSISINWLIFGSNHHVQEPDGLLLENYTRSDLILNPHVKSFVRPAQIIQPGTPHYYVIKDPKKMFSINNDIMKNRPDVGFSFNEWSVEYFKSPAYIAHYLYQSEEIYLKRKVNLPTDDTGNFRGKIPNIHAFHNGFENLEPKEKYASRVKIFLYSNNFKTWFPAKRKPSFEGF